MKSLIAALALAGALGAAAVAPANAADDCGWGRHYSNYFGHCVWNGRDHDEIVIINPFPQWRWWWWHRLDRH